MNIRMNKEKGFTLIELLVVVAIIGTLSGMVLVAMGGAREKARDSVRRSDMRQLVSAQEMYYGDNEEYYTTSTDDGIPPIPSYLRQVHDPSCPDGTCSGHSSDYTWIDNTGASGLDCSNDDYDEDQNQWFCSYAVLEQNPSDAGCGADATTTVAASHKGTMYVCGTPTVSSDCTCFIE